jgi:hypothetical protein
MRFFLTKEMLITMQRQNHERYLHKVLVLTSEYATMSQIEESYKRATGKPIPAVPGAFAWLLVKMNKATQALSDASLSGIFPVFILTVM